MMFQMKSSPGRARRSLVRSTSRAAFTLIELLLVLMILAVLAVVVVPKLTGRAQDAQNKAAKAEIANIKTALRNFEVDNTHFPSTDEGLMALVQKPTNADNWKGYLETMPEDPWHHPYIYRFPGSNGKDFDLFSMGPDGQENTPDDIH
jgi:general secretion pathway protein G